MASVLTDDGESFVLHHVVLLFTNTSVNEALYSICNQLGRDKELTDGTNLQTDDTLWSC